MPTSFTSPTNGQTADASHVSQFAAPINNLESGAALYAESAGSATVYTATLAPVPALVAGLTIRLKIDETNSGAATLNVNGTGAVDIRYDNGSAYNTALPASFLKAGGVYQFTYQGTYWLVTGGAAAGGGSVATLDDVGDVDVTGAANGTVLMKTGSGWEDRNLAIADVNSLQSSLDGKASSSHNHSASEITSGTMATARLGSGTADSTKFLRGDQTWQVPPSSSWKGCVTTTPYLGIAATTLTTLPFDYDIIADAAIHSPTTNNSRFTADSSGKWELSFTGKFSDASPDVDVRVYSNGSSNYSYSTHGKAPTTISFSIIFDLAATDYLEIKVYASGVINLYSSPGALDANNANYARAMWRKIA